MLDGLNKWVQMFLAVGIIAAIGVVVLAAVQGGLTDAQACTSGNATLVNGTCVDPNNSSSLEGSTTVAYNTSENSQTAVVNLTSQLGSAGTIAGIAAIVLAAVLILGYFGFGRRV